MTGMGEVVPVADTPGLIHGIEQVLDDRPHYVRPRSEIEHSSISTSRSAAYEELFEHEIKKRRNDSGGADARSRVTVPA